MRPLAPPPLPPPYLDLYLAALDAGLIPVLPLDLPGGETAQIQINMKRLPGDMIFSGGGNLHPLSTPYVQNPSKQTSLPPPHRRQHKVAPALTDTHIYTKSVHTD